MSEKIGLSRPFLIKALNLLDKAQLIHQVHKPNKGISQLSKPDKLYLRNTNLIYAIADNNADVGNIRETFFVNQVSQLYSLTLAKEGDFIVDDRFIFEVGGKNKSNKQIHGIKDAFLVKDEIEAGVFNTIPLWLFGFLY